MVGWYARKTPQGRGRRRPRVRRTHPRGIRPGPGFRRPKGTRSWWTGKGRPRVGGFTPAGHYPAGVPMADGVGDELSGRGGGTIGVGEKEKKGRPRVGGLTRGTLPGLGSNGRRGWGGTFRPGVGGPSERGRKKRRDGRGRRPGIPTSSSARVLTGPGYQLSKPPGF